MSEVRIMVSTAIEFFYLLVEVLKEKQKHKKNKSGDHA